MLLAGPGRRRRGRRRSTTAVADDGGRPRRHGRGGVGAPRPTAGAGDGRGAGGRRGRGGGAGGRAAAAAAGGMGGALGRRRPSCSPQVDALPPADDEPEVDVAAEAAPPTRRSASGGSCGRTAAGCSVGLALVALDALLHARSARCLVRHGIDHGVRRPTTGALWVAVGRCSSSSVLVDWVGDVGLARCVTGRTAERLLLRAAGHGSSPTSSGSALDYYDREMAGRIMTRMTTDIEALSQLLQTGLVNALVSVLTFVGVVVFLLSCSTARWRSSPLPVAAAAGRRDAAGSGGSRAGPTSAARERDRRGERQPAGEPVGRAGRAGLRPRGPQHRAASARSPASYLDARLDAQRLVAIYFPFVELLVRHRRRASCSASAPRLVARRRRSPPATLIAFLLYLNLFFAPIQQLSQVFDT